MALRGVCGLFGNLGKKIIGMASDILITRSPTPKWINQNKPAPSSRNACD
jgi:hypothetical protein